MKFKKFEHTKDFYLKDNQIILTPEGQKKASKPKKITGSRVASILGKNKFSSPFQTWCDMLGFVVPEIEELFVNAGKVIEPKLLDFFNEKMNKKFISYDPMKIQFDMFKDVEIFGGIPDGEEYHNGEINSILEIKTTAIDKYQWEKKNNELKLKKDEEGKPTIISYGGGLSKWFKDKKFIIPVDYQYQLGLYLFLRKVEVGYFGVAFLNLQDYLNPENFDPNKTQTYNNLVVDDKVPEHIKPLFSNSRVIVIEEMRINLEKFKGEINKAKDWYKDHIIAGISPSLSSEDLEWFRFGFPSI